MGKEHSSQREEQVQRPREGDGLSMLEEQEVRLVRAVW